MNTNCMRDIHYSNIGYPNKIMADQNICDEACFAFAPGWGQYIDLEKVDLQTRNRILPIERYFVDQSGLHTIDEKCVYHHANSQYDKSYGITQLFMIKIKDNIITCLRRKRPYIVLGMVSCLLWTSIMVVV